MKKILIWIIALLVLSTTSLAYLENGHINLLTVSETSNETALEQGGVADLNLLIKPGSGRIFIDSFPLSRLDTQITMRFAAEIACDFLEKDCSGYDFFYTIRANSAIVGGPSAGAAATVLTLSMLDDQNINEKVIMTGTINSGNLIGPVAGINAKTYAAQKSGFEKVLIPKWDFFNNSNNLSIRVVQVSTLEEALFEFTGKDYKKNHSEIKSIPEYDNLMKQITIDLCTKYGSMKNGTIIMPNLSELIKEDVSSKINITNNQTNISINETKKDYYTMAVDAINNNSYYSAASFCFAGNVRLTRESLKNHSSKKLKQEYAKTLGDISIFELKLNEKSKSITTLSELETYMIVKERIEDSKQVLRDQNPENISYSDLGYAIERYNTAVIWSKFFDIQGKSFVQDNDALAIACNNKIAETEERLSYLQIYLPEVDRADLKKAYSYYESKDYALCIYTASKAKADADVVLSAISVTKENFAQLVNDKIAAAENSIAEQQSHDIFPILGYSYYEYSKTLRDSDPYSSLLYAEYALELSNLDMYLPIKKNGAIQVIQPKKSIDPRVIQGFVLGLIIGTCFTVIVLLMILKIRIKNEDKKSLKNKPRKTPLAK